MIFYFTRGIISFIKNKEWSSILFWSAISIFGFVVAAVATDVLWLLWFLPIVPIAFAVVCDLFLIIVIAGGYIPFYIFSGIVLLVKKIFKKE